MKEVFVDKDKNVFVEPLLCQFEKDNVHFPKHFIGNILMFQIKMWNATSEFLAALSRLHIVYATCE